MILKPLRNFMIIASLSLGMLYSCQETTERAQVSKEIIQVEYPEAYELANIILSLTEYGKTDPMEVRKDFEYYSDVQEYFSPVNNHPLLDSVNYSREEWESYLSFRTDSYAFDFDENNQLSRKFEFVTNEGFQPFDDHLDLINDFVQESNFRAFYQDHQAYYESVKNRYKETQYLNEMREFLIREFGAQYANNSEYKVVLSPFVYRMNCHRDIDSTTAADFITIPDYVLTDTITINEKDVATSIHSLFTEMDHGYVNPTTEKHKDLIDQYFTAELWDNESGYNEGSGYDQTGSAVFNEYMTWGVYDIFLKEYFPAYSQELGLYWSYQNDSRGFPYTYLFTQQLVSLYDQKKENETLKDLYPELLLWTAQVQPELSKPLIDTTWASISDRAPDKTKVTISFSEPMRQTDFLSTIFQDGQQTKLYLDLSKTEHHLNWTNDGKTVEFEIVLPADWEGYYFQFNWWGTPYPLVSAKGILMKYASFFQVTSE